MTWLMVLTLPYLCAAYATNKIWQSRGVDGFRNPGGWKLPIGEVAAWEGECEAGHVVRWVELFEPPVIVEAT